MKHQGKQKFVSCIFHDTLQWTWSEKKDGECTYTINKYYTNPNKSKNKLNLYGGVETPELK